MTLTRKSFFLFVLPIFFLSCVSQKRPVTHEGSAKAAMLQADRNFSQLSAQKGMKEAFLEYIDSNGVLLRPNVLPIAGSEAVDYLIAINDSNFTMTWEPSDGFTAAAGDMGYTFGTYTLQPKLKDTLLYGTYVSIWKKNEEGKWKFVLDSGNEGIGEAEVAQ